MSIEDLLSSGVEAESIITELKKKSIYVKPWDELEKEYNTSNHPVNDHLVYPDKVDKKSQEAIKVTRFTIPLQKLAVKRMAELLFAIPVKRVYNPKNEAEKKVQTIMESIFQKNRIDSVNNERGRQLYAACEAATLWYTQELQDGESISYGGEPTRLKIRCKSFSPFREAKGSIGSSALYPHFNEYDDLDAMSFAYTRTDGDEKIEYFDTYTAKEHIRWVTRGGEIQEELREENKLGKIPAIYVNREEPIWEDQSQNVYEAEWTLSRNGNYIRKNAKPTWVECSDEPVQHGGEDNRPSSDRNILHYPAGSTAGYATWPQATESIKFQIEMIVKFFFMSLQLPDMSYDNMKTTPMSGEARKMMLIDAQMKAGDESGLWVTAFDREINVVRSIMKLAYPSLASAIDSLEVENVITPFMINDENEVIGRHVTAVAGKVESRKTAIANLGMVDDVDAELEQINQEAMAENLANVMQMAAQ